MSGNHVLLLNEPFGALDALNRLGMHRFLLGVRLKLDLAMLFVTHDPGEAVALTERIAAMSPRPGRIVNKLAIRLGHPSKGARAASALATYRARLLVALGSGIGASIGERKFLGRGARLNL